MPSTSAQASAVEHEEDARRPTCASSRTLTSSTPSVERHRAGGDQVAAMRMRRERRPEPALPRGRAGRPPRPSRQPSGRCARRRRDCAVPRPRLVPSTAMADGEQPRRGHDDAPALRASDAERERTATLLRDHCRRRPADAGGAGRAARRRLRRAHGRRARRARRTTCRTTDAPRAPRRGPRARPPRERRRAAACCTSSAASCSSTPPASRSGWRPGPAAPSGRSGSCSPPRSALAFRAWAELGPRRRSTTRRASAAAACAPRPPQLPGPPG